MKKKRGSKWPVDARKAGMLIVGTLAAMCILAPGSASAYDDVVVHSIDVVDDTGSHTGSAYSQDFVVPAGHDYDFGLFVCEMDGNRTAMTLLDITFSDQYYIQYAIDNRSSGSTNVIIAIKELVEYGERTLDFTMSESPAWAYCDLVLFDLNKDIDKGVAAKQYVSARTLSTNPTITYVDPDEDEMLFFYGADCVSCGAIDGSLSSGWDEIELDPYVLFGYNTSPTTPNTILHITGATPLGYWSNHGFSIQLKDESPGLPADPPEYEFYSPAVSGDYTIPKYIKCFDDDSGICTMVFGFGTAAFARAITEDDPADQVYPNWGWYYPTLSDPPIATSTLRTTIDQGLSSYVLFSFPSPGTSTTYWLEIQDPDDPIIGSSSSFQVDTLWITSSSTDIMATCLGECDEGLLGTIFCGIKRAFCFAAVPTSNSTMAVKSGFDKLRTKFPMNILTELTDAARSGLDQVDDRTGTIPIPLPTTGGDLVMVPVISSTTMSDAIGSDNADTLRTTIIYIMWILAGVSIVAFLVSQQRR